MKLKVNREYKLILTRQELNVLYDALRTAQSNWTGLNPTDQIYGIVEEMLEQITKAK